MPPKKKSQKNNSETYYQPKKRKVLSLIQISSEQILHTKDNNGRVNGQSGQRSALCVSPDSDQNSQNKRFHQSQQQYFDFGSYVTSNSDAAISRAFHKCHKCRSATNLWRPRRSIHSIQRRAR